jgi:hypothetical protein
MQMASKNIPAIRPQSTRGKSAGAPIDTKAIADKIEAERERIFQAMSMIATVNKILLQDGEVGDEADESPLWFALKGVHGVLDSINAKLDEAAMMMSGREVAHV